jgi:cytochrome c oxidase cbb3-type subunit 3
MSDEKKENHETPVHEYDGILELDHPVPRWFHALFYGSIAFAILYSGWYFLGPALKLTDEWERDSKALAYQLYVARQSAPVPTELGEAELAAWARDPARTQAGSKVYASKCAACHGANGQGSIGPNLTDDHWLHGGSLVEVARSVREGIPDKGMPPWGAVIGAEEVHAVTAYIRSLRGTNPPDAKAPQGELVKF